MATDASRRWLDNSVWSCRIKLPADNSKISEETQARTIAPAPAMDVPLALTSPSSRRNQGKLAEAIQSMTNLNNSMESLDLPTDPDAQATVTDFLDFTEYLPSDMIRSLTLIGNLDQSYCDASANLNDLTKKYGDLPNLPLSERADPVSLRKDISQNLAETVGARTSAHAEACRMAENVDRHYNRAKNILAKLQDMMDKFPTSREASPDPLKKSPTMSRAPKITLRVGGESSRGRKHRAPRITVPGEVLAPYELDYESYGSESDDYEEEAITPRATPRRTLGTIDKASKITLKIARPKKEKSANKPTRSQRPPGVMGTNVHSSVAGISTSNAIAMLKPPPADSVNGSEHKPWLQLTAWELANLRKRMKKNAIWSPSDTMIARELKLLNRGVEGYRAAKAKVEAAGEVYDQPVPPQLNGETVNAEGAISVEAVAAQEVQTDNKGTKLNEARKLKRQNDAKERAKMAAQEAEQSIQKVVQAAAQTMKGLFESPGKEVQVTITKTPGKTPSKSHKRKREDSEAERDLEKADEQDPTKITRPLLKRNKTETPVPVPLSITKQATPATVESSSTITSAAQTPTESLPPPLPSPRKAMTPILPPTKNLKRAIKKEPAKTEPPLSSRTRQASTGKEPSPDPAPESTPTTSKRPTSSRSNAALEGTQATATIDRPRRASTARNTPAPSEPRQASKRVKRPAPGPITAGSEGSFAVSVGKRKQATRKKAGTKKEKMDGSTMQDQEQEQLYDEVDDEGRIIPPDEEKYCLCNRVSFGLMMACDGPDCEKEWFHIECVGIKEDEMPGRRAKWYCPDCKTSIAEIETKGKKK